MNRLFLMAFSFLVTWPTLQAHERTNPDMPSYDMTHQPPRRILFIGDSITDGGWGNSGGSSKESSQRSHGDMNHIFGHGYMEMCAAYFMSQYPQCDFQFFNRGISGNTLYDLQKRWKTDALELNPDIVTILVGTNDVHEFLNDAIMTGFDYKRWELTYRNLIDQLKEQNPDVIIVLAPPFVAKAGWVGEADNFNLRRQMVEQLAHIVRQIADDYHAVIMPCDELFRTIQKEAPRDNYWIWDGIHPTTAGHRRMADLWIQMMENRLVN